MAGDYERVRNALGRSTAARWGRSSASGIELRIEQQGAPGSNLAAALAGTLERDTQASIRRMADLHEAAMKVVGDRFKGELRADIRSGGFHQANRLANTWRVKTYRDGADDMEPALFIWTRAGLIVDAFTQGATIRARNATFLAIPQGPAKAIVRRMNRAANRSRDDFGRFAGEANPVARVEAALGVELVAVFDRSRRAGVLITADSRRLTATGRASRSTRSGGGTVLFVLVRQATLKRRIQGRRLLDSFARRFEGEFGRALQALLSPEERA